MLSAPQTGDAAAPRRRERPGPPLQTIALVARQHQAKANWPTGPIIFQTNHRPRPYECTCDAERRGKLRVSAAVTLTL